MPTDEHRNATPHDVESSPLFLNQFGTFSSERTSPLWRISHQRTRGTRRRRWWTGSRRSLLLGQLPFLLHVERRRDGGGGGRGKGSHVRMKMWGGVEERFELWQKWKVLERESGLLSFEGGSNGIYKRLKKRAWQWESHTWFFFPFPIQRYAIIILYIFLFLILWIYKWYFWK